MPDDKVSELAGKVLLPIDEVRWYFDHLETVQESKERSKEGC